MSKTLGLRPALGRAGFMGLVMLAACSPRQGEPEPGVYRAAIETPRGEIPFALEISLPPSGGEGGTPAVYLLEGDSREAFDTVARVEQALEARLPGGAATLTFTARGTRLSGQVRLADGTGSTEAFAFTAESGVAYRFFRESATDNADVAGRWSATVRTGGRESAWLLLLAQSHDQVTGTFHGPDGIAHRVSGQVRDDDVRLSSFDGRTALLFTASVTQDGGLQGDAWSNLSGSGQWRAWRNPDAEMPQDAGGVATTTPMN